MRKSLVFVLAGLAAVQLCAQGVQRDAKWRDISYAKHYVEEFEKEVARQRGGEKAIYRSKNDALTRVQKLKQSYPGDPEVEALFQRTKKALMRSKGDYTEVPPEWTAYKRNEANLRKVIAEAGEKEWQAFLAARKGALLEKAFPAPDSDKVTVDDLAGKLVVLDSVEYPRHQFYGATGEYVHCGKPSEGYYFVNIATRDWLGPYEAVKRYRRNVDSGLGDVDKWTAVGEIVNIVGENPNGGEDAVGNIQFGWVVKPVALFVPGRVMAVFDASAPSSGRFVGEEQVDGIKAGWYTVTEIPQDVTPERLMEIFMTAIKEKNFALYQECIDPERRKTDTAEDLLRYHWDLHQERFHKEYVHATFSKAKITTVKGFDESNDLENFFLDDDQQATLKKIGGEKIEYADVDSKAFDENGKQVGSPHPHRLIRRGGGRWYVEEYAPRF